MTGIHVALERAQVAGSVGWAPITVLRGLPTALVEAGGAMYAAKRWRPAVRTASRERDAVPA